MATFLDADADKLGDVVKTGTPQRLSDAKAGFGRSSLLTYRRRNHR
jgi:hypothetical protein